MSRESYDFKPTIYNINKPLISIAHRDTIGSAVQTHKTLIYI